MIALHIFENAKGAKLSTNLNFFFNLPKIQGGSFVHMQEKVGS
jgi:hypothetical protein